MSGKSEAKAVQLVANLPQLQNWIKRDPESYKDEFITQWQYFHTLMQAFQLQPTKYNEKLDGMITFIAQVSHCYKEDLAELPEQLGDMLRNHSTVLDRTIRMTLIKALIMLRNKDMISATQVLQLFFKLLRCEDKLLRKTIYQYVVNDIKTVNQKHKNNKLNSALQNYMYSMIQESNGVTVKTALDIMKDLYKRNIWNDAKTVNVIATVCFSKITKAMVSALKFFLGKDETEEGNDSDSSDDESAAGGGKRKDAKKNVQDLQLGHRVGRKTKKRKKKLDRALQAVKRHRKKKTTAEVYNNSALHLLYDPQDFAEKLFRHMEKSTERFEVRLMMIDLISRLVGVHKLLLLNFYPFMKRFVQPHQREVTRLMLYLSQGTHEMVPPECVEEVVRTIAMNFIAERNSSEVMAVGLNAVREMCSRCPLAMACGDGDLLQDLVQYKSHRDKAVMMAARSLLTLYRNTNPELLHRKDRGRPTEAQKELKAAGVAQYGEQRALSFIPGAEVIPEIEEKEAEAEEEGGQGGSGGKKDGWESASDTESDEDDSDGDWVDVHHSSDEEEVEKGPEQTAEEKEEKQRVAEDVSTTRIMTNKDFKAISSQQAAKTVTSAGPQGGRKRKRPANWGDKDTGEELPKLGDIEMVHKKRLVDRESKIAASQAGREGRDKFSHGPAKMNPNASTNNKEKRKQKVFGMVKHKIRRKTVKRSFKEKQVALRNSLLKRAKNSRY